MFFLVYVSSSTHSLSRGELSEILMKAREYNSKFEITGLLLYKGGNVMQVLEGEEIAVRNLYGKIQLDRRHVGLIKLIEGTQPARQFADWSMAYRDLGSRDAVMPEGYSDFLNTTLSGEEFATQPARSLKLLRMFRESVR